ncbi:MAG: phosphodiester glycosidase family protein [Limisphaerales bacterium]
MVASIAFAATEDGLPGLAYTNSRIAEVPWSIHVVQVERANPNYQIRSVHARDRAVGLDTLSDQVGLIHPAEGAAVAAISGDYYEREKAYAGAPRGLQIVDGELLSGPSGEASFWINAIGEPHIERTQSLFHVTWPDGTTAKFGLNGERRPDGLELYTEEIGTSTQTKGGCELVLTRAAPGPWLPLRIGQNYVARVEEIRQAGDTPMTSNCVVLSVGPDFPRACLAKLEPGALLRLSTDSQPALHGIRMAISGGPILVRDGRREKINAEPGQAYEISSMAERHPRAAVGWNKTSFFLVEVDGRQKGLSAGMTLDELGKLLLDLGCEQAMNLDGGGSAVLWYNGEVRNSPADRVEREIANCLVVIKKKK